MFDPARLEADGYALAVGALPDDLLAELRDACEPLLAGLTRVQGGVREVWARVPLARGLAADPRVRRLVEPALGRSCVAVSATLFDKSGGRNWKVPYHQDVTIRVKERRDVPGFGTWWEKAGVPHVWPPAAVLEGMLAVRLHLDDCGPGNGPLRVLPGTHRGGVLESAAIEGLRVTVSEVTCTASRGDALLMRPLLLHASSPASELARRRVLHIEYAAGELPGGLQWADAVGGV